MYTITGRHLCGACLYTTYALAMAYALYRHGGLFPVTSVRLFFACQFGYSVSRASYDFADPRGTSANLNDTSQNTANFLGGLSFCFSTAFMLLVVFAMSPTTTLRETRLLWWAGVVTITIYTVTMIGLNICTTFLVTDMSHILWLHRAEAALAGTISFAVKLVFLIYSRGKLISDDLESIIMQSIPAATRQSVNNDRVPTAGSLFTASERALLRQTLHRSNLALSLCMVLLSCQFVVYSYYVISGRSILCNGACWEYDFVKHWLPGIGSALCLVYLMWSPGTTGEAAHIRMFLDLDAMVNSGELDSNNTWSGTPSTSEASSTAASHGMSAFEVLAHSRVLTARTASWVQEDVASPRKRRNRASSNSAPVSDIIQRASLGRTTRRIFARTALDVPLLRDTYQPLASSLPERAQEAGRYKSARAVMMGSDATKTGHQHEFDSLTLTLQLAVRLRSQLAFASSSMNRPGGTGIQAALEMWRQRAEQHVMQHAGLSVHVGHAPHPRHAAGHGPVPDRAWLKTTWCGRTERLGVADSGRGSVATAIGRDQQSEQCIFNVNVVVPLQRTMSAESGEWGFDNESLRFDLVLSSDAADGIKTRVSTTGRGSETNSELSENAADAKDSSVTLASAYCSVNELLMTERGKRFHISELAVDLHAACDAWIDERAWTALKLSDETFDGANGDMVDDFGLRLEARACAVRMQAPSQSLHTNMRNASQVSYRGSALGELDVDSAQMRRYYSFELSKSDPRLLRVEEALDEASAATVFSLPAMLLDSLIGEHVADAAGLERHATKFRAAHAIGAQNQSIAGQLPQRPLAMVRTARNRAIECGTAQEIQERVQREYDYLDELRRLRTICEYAAVSGVTDKYSGRVNLGFKPSTAKGSHDLAFIATNLHEQRLAVTVPVPQGWSQHAQLRAAAGVVGVTRCTGCWPYFPRDLSLSRDSDHDNSRRHVASIVYDFVTVGAAAAHSLGFEQGGILRLQEELEKDTASQEILRWQLRCRTEIVSSQAISAVAAVIQQRMHLWGGAGARCESLSCPAVLEAQHALRLLAKTRSFLVQWESLLSTRGKEMGMLEDLAGIMPYLSSHFTLELMPLLLSENNVAQASSLAPVLEAVDATDRRRGMMLRIPFFCRRSHLPPDVFEVHGIGKCHSLRLGLTAVVFTMGINEQQTLVHLNPLQRNSQRQEKINCANARTLGTFLEARIRALNAVCNAAATQGPISQDLREPRYAGANELKAQFADVTSMLGMRGLNQGVPKPMATASTEPAADAASQKKNVRLLQRVADLCRALGGGRITICKSAKDRTSMSVTLEQVRMLQAIHGLHPNSSQDALDAIRLHGVRIANAHKNVGRRVFAFNEFQQLFLPNEYRPPSNARGKTLS